MSDPINEMFPSGGGMRGEPALVCVTYDSNGDPCGISGLPDFAGNYVEALAAERDRLAAENKRLRDALQCLLRFAENTESELRIVLDSADLARAALAAFKEKTNE